MHRRLERETERLISLERQRRSLDPKGPLARGYALIRRADGSLARSAAALYTGEQVAMEFAEGRRTAVVETQPVRRRATAGHTDERQGDLF